MATYAIGTYSLTVAITGPVADPRNFAETATLTIVGGVDTGVAEEFSGYTEGSIRREYALGVATEIDDLVTGRIMGSLACHGGLAGLGGIAGNGGGIAG